MRAKILNASAGSGKTYQLAYKYVKDVITTPQLYSHILAVTFTNKATEEMKSRILSEIGKLASKSKSPYLEKLTVDLPFSAEEIAQRAKQVQTRILHDYSRFTILTIDKFFQRILRAFIKELGIDLNYNLEIETASILAQSADLLVEQVAEDGELRDWIMEFIGERIEENKKWDIREGILSLGGEIFKESNKSALDVAKTKKDLQKIVSKLSKQAKESKDLIVEKAKQSLAIIADLGLDVNDFAQKKSGVGAYLQNLANGTISAPNSYVLAAADSVDKWFPKSAKGRTVDMGLYGLLNEICDLYNSNTMLWNSVALLSENYRSFALLADLYGEVQKMCEKENVMLLSETKYILSEFVRHNDTPFIYEKVGNRFDRFMMDEFQDTSTKEWENFLPLLQNAMSQSEDCSVLIVGDIKQSIYRWRGGDWKLLHSKAQQALGDSETEVENLDENYRSLPLIVEFNNNIISKIVESDNTNLNNLITGAKGKAVDAELADSLYDTLKNAYRGHAQKPRKKSVARGEVRISKFENEPAIVERIKELIDRGFEPQDILILVRGATDASRVASMLLEFKNSCTESKYDFDIMTQEALSIGVSPIVMFVMNSLRLALDPSNSVARGQYQHYLDPTTRFVEPLTEAQLEHLQSIRLLSPEEAFEQIVIFNNLSLRERDIAYLQALHEQVISFCANRVADVALFIEWWDEHGCKKSLSTQHSSRSIEILTVHRAKGLEKKVVLIPYCNWELNPKASGLTQNIVWSKPSSNSLEIDDLGSFPVRYKEVMANSAFSNEYYAEKVYSHVDNVNLLYVALTRAVESLHIFVPRSSRKEGVDKLLWDAVEVGDDCSIKVGDLEGVKSVVEGCEEYCFGQKAAPEAGGNEQSATSSVITSDYPTAMPNLSLRLPSQRYFEDDEQVELSPQNFGILMHKAFEQAENVEQIFEQVDLMERNAIISTEQKVQLSQMIDEALTNPIIKSWFEESWHDVRNEAQIVLPGKLSMRRPDRVMISSSGCVVVDYKFGEQQLPQHRTQIGEYVALLRDMKYDNVKGYLWYVKLGVVVEV